MIYNARHAGVDNVKLVLATIIPRTDGRNPETQIMNEEAVIPIAERQERPPVLSVPGL